MALFDHAGAAQAISPFPLLPVTQHPQAAQAAPSVSYTGATAPHATASQAQPGGSLLDTIFGRPAASQTTPATPGPRPPASQVPGQQQQGGPPMAITCPAPSLGTLYHSGLDYFVYLKDGLHGIPATQLVSALGYNPGLAQEVDHSCIVTIGQSTDLAPDFPTAYAQLQNGLGVSVNPAGMTVPSGTAGITQATTAANTAIGGASGILSSAENAITQHEGIILAALAFLFVSKSGLLKGLRL